MAQPTQLDLATTFTISTIVHLMMAVLLGLFWRSALRRARPALAGGWPTRPCWPWARCCCRAAQAR